MSKIKSNLITGIGVLLFLGGELAFSQGEFGPLSFKSAPVPNPPPRSLSDANVPGSNTSPAELSRTNRANFARKNILGPDAIAPDASAQTDFVPVESLSWRSGAPGGTDAFEITFNGQNIPSFSSDVGPHHQVPGGDISAFARQTDGLRFSEMFALANPSSFANPSSLANPSSRLALDNTSPVVEPRTLWLVLSGVTLLGFRVRRKRRASRLLGERTVGKLNNSGQGVGPLRRKSLGS